MKRRDFLLTACATTLHGASQYQHGFGAGTNPTQRIDWTFDSATNQYVGVSCNGTELGPPRHNAPLMQAHARVLGPREASNTAGALQVNQQVILRQSPTETSPNVLQTTLGIKNVSGQTHQIEISFQTVLSPDPQKNAVQDLYLPLNVAGMTGDKRFASLGGADFLGDGNVHLNDEEFRCHYLEPMASDPNQRETTALLLVPVIDISATSADWRVGIFTSSDSPMQFVSNVDSDEQRTWTARRILSLEPGESLQESCWVVLHRSDASDAWKAFHQFAHVEEYQPIAWTHDFKVHYYDYLSSADGEHGVRGDGYDADLPHFPEFHVGLATQHGYYPHLGDYIHPDRKTWQAMRGSKQGSATMSIEKMRQRVADTRNAGAKAGIYMHLTLIDDRSELFDKFADGRRVGPDGQPIRFPWSGPDVEGQCWWMSIASKPWREHLLQQAQWIMEYLDPDAICFDETFAGIGYDEAPGRQGPLSPHAIEFFRDLRAIVRSFGDDRAVFSSDCSRSAFCLWTDGDVGDHAYANSLGNPLYTQEPVRYLAALGDKAWRPCAWHFRQMWEPQMKLARQVGAGVGVSNGWIEYDGLHAMPAAEKEKIITDIESIL
ncbi:hypothetical protein [Rhodopirellula sallentina]|uniref:Secreted protein n=1 Tax=Rhodopirellula sallentina SM41 TaxID=1263870 RepID=M5U754_9BACT|nr:hypothetical protein [Rhodopirellula sallentina]EMI51778.1 secreted protein [Rhodopirellula sallentina SM41]